MRKAAVAVVLVTAWLAAASAQAATTYDFVFRPGGGGAASGSQYTFFSLTAAQSGQAIMDVLLRTSEPLRSMSVSIGFDDSRGLAVTQAAEWTGIFLGMNAGNRFDPIVPGVTVGPSTLSSFDGESAGGITGGGSSLPPGTYHIGTVIWDTSGAGPGISSIFAFLLAGTDGTTAEFPAGNIVDVTGTETLGSGFINIVPEPGTAALLGLGVTALVLRARLRRAPGSPIRRHR